MMLQDGSIVHFKAKVTTPFRKLMTAYCDRQSVAAESVVFLFEGERLRGEQTPQEVGCRVCINCSSSMSCMLDPAATRRLAWKMGTALMLSSTKLAVLETEVIAWSYMHVTTDMLSVLIARHGNARGVHPSVIRHSGLRQLCKCGQMATPIFSVGFRVLFLCMCPSVYDVAVLMSLSTQTAAVGNPCNIRVPLEVARPKANPRHLDVLVAVCQGMGNVNCQI